MHLIPSAPVSSIHGKVYGLRSPTHVRTNHRGLVYTARTGHPLAKPTAAQLANLQRMRLVTLEASRILHTPWLRRIYEADCPQSVRLYDHIKHCLWQTL